MIMKTNVFSGVSDVLRARTDDAMEKKAPRTDAKFQGQK